MRCCAQQAGRDHASGGGEATSTGRSTGPAVSFTPMSSARTAARSRAGALAGRRSRARRRSASCTSRPTKSTARSGRPACSPRRLLCAELALLGLQGGDRSSGPRLAPHLRAAGPDHQLLEQLRALPVPGKTDPAHDPQRPRRQAAAGLRRRPECARLALRRGSLPGAEADPGRGRPGETYNVGGRNERGELRVVERSAPLLDAHAGALPAGRATPQPRSPLSPTAPATTGATPSTRPNSNSELGLAAAGDVRDRPAKRRSTGICATGPGAAAARPMPAARAARALTRARGDGPIEFQPDGGNRDEGHHPGRGLGHAAVSADLRRQQTAAAGLRQADDLLSAVGADAGGHPRDPDHLDAARTCRRSRGCSATAASSGIRSELRGAAAPEGLAQAFIIGRGFRRRRAVRADARRQHLLRPRPRAELLRAGRCAHDRRDGVRLSGRRPQRYGVVEFDERRPRRRRSRRSRAKPQIELRGDRALFLRREVVEIAESSRPSPRGELEITDLNRAYLHRGSCRWSCSAAAMPGSTPAPTIADAGRRIRPTIEQRQGLKIGCLEEIAFDRGWIDHNRLEAIGAAMKNTEYGAYLLQLAASARPKMALAVAG